MFRKVEGTALVLSSKMCIPVGRWNSSFTIRYMILRPLEILSTDPFLKLMNIWKLVTSIRVENGIWIAYPLNSLTTWRIWSTTFLLFLASLKETISLRVILVITQLYLVVLTITTLILKHPKGSNTFGSLKF